MPRTRSMGVVRVAYIHDGSKGHSVLISSLIIHAIILSEPQHAIAPLVFDRPRMPQAPSQIMRLRAACLHAGGCKNVLDCSSAHTLVA